MTYFQEDQGRSPHAQRNAAIGLLVTVALTVVMLIVWAVV